MSNKKRIVAIFSGSRSEYGLQYPILKAIKDHSDLDYRLIVSGLILIIILDERSRKFVTMDLRFMLR